MQLTISNCLLRISRNPVRTRSSWCWTKVPGPPSPTRSPRVFWGKLGSLRRARPAWSTLGTPATWTASSRPSSWPQSESRMHTQHTLVTFVYYILKRHQHEQSDRNLVGFLVQFQAACFIITSKWLQHAHEKAPAALRIPCTHSG